jgi:hypothetical protein
MTVKISLASLVASKKGSRALKKSTKGSDFGKGLQK